MYGVSAMLFGSDMDVPVESQVVYVCLGSILPSDGYTDDKPWRAVLWRMGLNVQPGSTGLETFSRLKTLPSGKDSLVLIFDEVTAFTTRPGMLAIFLQQLRSLRQEHAFMNNR